MQYVIKDNAAVIRLDRGEELIASLLEFAQKEGITCAQVGGIGASDDFSVGLFDFDTKTCVGTDFRQSAEITSICGNLSVKDGKPYAHLHANFGLQGGSVVGGHLTKAVISVTCELFVTFFDIVVERKYDQNIGINLMEFNKK